MLPCCLPLLTSHVASVPSPALVHLEPVCVFVSLCCHPIHCPLHTHTSPFAPTNGALSSVQPAGRVAPRFELGVAAGCHLVIFDFVVAQLC